MTIENNLNVSFIQPATPRNPCGTDEVLCCSTGSFPTNPNPTLPNPVNPLPFERFTGCGTRNPQPYAPVQPGTVSNYRSLYENFTN